MNVVLLCQPQGLPWQDIGFSPPSHNRLKQGLAYFNDASEKHSKEKKNHISSVTTYRIILVLEHALWMTLAQRVLVCGNIDL